MILLSYSRVSQDQFVEKWQQKSYNSGCAAQKALAKYNKFLASIHETDESVLSKLHEIKNSEEFYLFLNRTVEYFSRDLHPKSVALYFNFVKDYFRKNGFRIYNEDVKQFVEFPKAQKEKKVPVTKKDIKLLCQKASPYMKGAILVLASSGMRPSEFLQMTKDDIDFDKNPVEVHLRSEITKTSVERITYLTPEAVANFPKLKKYDVKNSLVNFEQSFADLRKRCGFVGIYRHSNVHHVTPHRLRAFFKSIASNKHGKDYAEYIIGHEGYLSTYYTIDDDTAAKKYNEMIEELTCL